MAWTPFSFFKYDQETHDFDKTTFNVKQALNDNWDHIKALIEELRGGIDNKVDAEEGKGLSTNDYTTEDKNKVANLPTNITEDLSKYAKTADVNEALATKAPAYSYGTEDMTAGTSELETGKLYFMYEE